MASERAETTAVGTAPVAEEARGVRVALSPYLFRGMLVGMAAAAVALLRDLPRGHAQPDGAAPAVQEGRLRARHRRRAPDRARGLPRHAAAHAARQPAHGRTRGGGDRDRGAHPDHGPRLRRPRRARRARARGDRATPHGVVIRALAISLVFVLAPAARALCPPAATTAASLQSSFGVGVRTLDLVDRSRRTPPHAGLPGSRVRTLPVEVWYPAAPAETGPVRDAPLAADRPSPP